MMEGSIQLLLSTTFLSFFDLVCIESSGLFPTFPYTYTEKEKKTKNHSFGK